MPSTVDEELINSAFRHVMDKAIARSGVPRIEISRDVMGRNDRRIYHVLEGTVLPRFSDFFLIALSEGFSPVDLFLRIQSTYWIFAIRNAVAEIQKKHPLSKTQIERLNALLLDYPENAIESITKYLEGLTEPWTDAALDQWRARIKRVR